MKSGLLLDVVVGEGSAILKLLSGENQSLLIWWNALLVLDLGLHVVDRVRRLNLQRDRFASQCLDEDLHSAAVGSGAGRRSVARRGWWWECASRLLPSGG